MCCAICFCVKWDFAYLLLFPQPSENTLYFETKSNQKVTRARVICLCTPASACKTNAYNFNDKCLLLDKIKVMVFDLRNDI